MLYDQLDFWRHEHRRFDPLDAEDLERLVQSLAARRRREGAVPENEEDAFRAVLARRPRTYASLYVALIRALKRSDKPRWGEKYAGRGLEVPRFVEAFPRGQVVVIVRDLRDVYLSERRRLERDNPAGAARGDHLLNVFNWRALVRLTRAYERTFGAERVMRLAYEDLVRDPARTVGALCHFLGLAPAAEMLDASTFTDDQGRTWEANSSFESGVRTITSRLSGRWEHDLSNEEIAFLESFAGSELEACGYTRSCRGSATSTTPELVTRTLRTAAAYVRASAYRPFLSAPTYAALGPTSHRTAAIWGTSPRSWSLAMCVADLGGTVAGYVAPVATPALWMDDIVLPADGEVLPHGAGVLVLEERDVVPGGELARLPRVRVDADVIDPRWVELERECAEECVVEAPRPFSGVAWTRDELNEWFDGVPAGWAVAGAAARVAPGEGGIGARIDVAEGVGSILRRHNFDQADGELLATAWARCDVVEAARVQISNARGDVASRTHPGDGRWHFLAVVGRIDGPFDLYLQLIRPGSATFSDVVTAPVAPTAWRDVAGSDLP